MAGPPRVHEIHHYPGGFPMRRIVLIAPALAGFLMLPGCGTEEKKEPAAEPRAPRAAKKGGKEKAQELEAATDGVIKGRVVLAGDPPKMPSLVPQMEKNQDKAVCL